MNKKIVYQAAILAILYLGYGFYYLTRKSLIFMVPHFRLNQTSTFNFTKNDIGIVISGQNFAYAISKLVGGVLSDVYSCRILFGSGLFLSGLLNIAFKKDIQVMWSILSTSSNVAGAIGPIIANTIALKYHWSHGFMIQGCICMTIGYLAIMVLRNKPSEVGFEDFGCKNAELDKNIEEIGFLQKSKQLFLYPFFVSICLCYFIVQFIKTLFSDWAHIYMIKSLQISSYNATYFLSIFELSGIFGSLFSGLVSDFVYHFKCKRIDHRKPTTPCSVYIRMLVNIVFFTGLLISLHLFNYYLDSKISRSNLLIIGTLSGFFCFGCVSLLGVIAMEFTPKSFSGSSHAYASLAANIGSISAGLPFGYISKLYTWSYGFRLTEALAGAILKEKN
ncbi:glucose-6-phosphate translocase isoform X2 [Brachionus plicatilis]|uniref:Glucose-6-phosphate translocase isoform X2 n=1 Tax=Brachionus plicatilis TaxID=10195 RepID=A0A3M7SC45_BRAPC|nr:glucose-6-phosphate translocase isoform X2 [Brachionus plicatilis]